MYICMYIYIYIYIIIIIIIIIIILIIRRGLTTHHLPTCLKLV